VRYAIFGGAFDPPHAGHLAVAQAAHDALDLDCVVYVPSFAPPHRGRPQASFHHRVGMLRAAVSGCPWAAVSGIELDLTAPTFTYDMVRALKSRLGSKPTPYLLVGADNYQSFTTWHEWRRLLDEVEVVVYPRGNSLPNGLSEVPARMLTASLREENSTILRKAFAETHHPETIPCLPKVTDYIVQYGLYGAHHGAQLDPQVTTPE
jgi:nicotinate-nucleotide adenylyltransferase